MKKYISIILLVIINLYGWEINSHRAVDRIAISKAANLSDLVSDTGISGYQYGDNETLFDGYGMTYTQYAVDGEENSIKILKTQNTNPSSKPEPSVLIKFKTLTTFLSPASLSLQENARVILPRQVRAGANHCRR